MQIKSESKVDKKVLDTLFKDLSKNQVLIKNAKNVKLYFEILDKIKNHRTLQKICQVCTKEERQIICLYYCQMIDELEDHMDTFQQFSMKASVRKNMIRIDKQNFKFDQWKQAIEAVSIEGETLTEAIESKLKLIIKAFDLNLRIPTLNWKRWRQLCTEGILVKKGYCGCFT